MNTEQIKISLKKLQGISIAEDEIGTHDNSNAVLTLNAELMNLGFLMSKALYECLSQCSLSFLEALHPVLVSSLKGMTGSDVAHKPMYPNFPTQVMEATNIELYINAIYHYWTFGEWKPDYKKLPRELAFEAVKYREINIVTENEVMGIFTSLLASADSISQEDKATIAWFIQNFPEDKLTYPKDIPFSENKCVVISELLSQGKDITKLVKTSTDILRVATYISEGDVSLASNTKFKSLPRKTRKILVKALEKVISEEDIGRHQKKWVRLFHNLHVGELSETVNKIAYKARNKQSLESFYSKLEFLYTSKDLANVVKLLRQRPGEFGRRLDQTLRLTESIHEQIEIVSDFLAVADNIPTRNLIQLLGHVSRRDKDIEKRVVYPKGNVQKAVLVNGKLDALDEDVVSALRSGIKSLLIARFSDKENLGKVWIDPELIDCPIPSQQRSASEGLFNVARGTRLPVGDKNTLRFFIYWVGQDIDLSASFHNEEFKLIEHVSYTNLRSSGYEAYHSGDITNAPCGASEFIDIAMDSALSSGARYITMNVLVYNGPNFEQHDTCYAGWMTRDKPKSNEIYDPKTVAQKIDVRSATRNVIPVIFDLRDRKAIWVDIAMNGKRFNGGNNIESNHASIEEKLEAIVTSEHKTSLYELFLLHAKARGTIVDSRENADTLFSLEEGITPYDINTITSQFID